MRSELAAAERNLGGTRVRHMGVTQTVKRAGVAMAVMSAVVASAAAPTLAAVHAPAAKYMNSLKITISGTTPAPPKVTVTGPKQTAASKTGYQSLVAKTTTLKGLTPGAYSITAKAVVKSGVTYVPKPASGRVTVKASGVFTFTVTYSKQSGSSGEPSAVTGLSVEPGESRLTVRWDISNPPKSVTYDVWAAAAGSTTRAGACLVGKSGCTIYGLRAGQPYTVTVTTKASAGQTWSASAEPIAPLRKGQVFFNGYTVGAGSNLRGANLQGGNFARLDLTGADLTGADLTGADLTGAKMASTTLDGATLTSATLRRVQSGLITGAPKLPKDWLLIGGYLVGDGADLTGAYLDGADFAGAHMTDVLLKGAHLAGADLHAISGATLRGLTLESADLQSANLAGLNLSGASLKSAVLLSANLSGANLSHAVLINTVDLRGANLRAANLTDADLTGADLRKADLSDAVLAGATLKAVRSEGIVGVPASLPADWALRQTYLVGPWAYLLGANLLGADLSGLTMTGANLGAAFLVGANLSHANLVGANLSGTDLSGATLTGLVATSLSGSTPKNIPAGWEYKLRALTPKP